MVDPAAIENRKILITGVTGQVAEPVVAAWSGVADVFGSLVVVGKKAPKAT